MARRGSDNQSGADHAPLTLADKLNHLISTVPVDGKSLSSEDLAQAVSALGDEHKLSADYVRKLRRGEMTNPSLRVLRGLAKVFSVRTSFFTDDSEETTLLQDPALTTALRDKNIRSLALRTSQLSPAGIRAIMEVVNALDDGADDHRPA